jgi:hypothetical protein
VDACTQLAGRVCACLSGWMHVYTACRVCAGLSEWMHVHSLQSMRRLEWVYVASTVFASLDECLHAHGLHSICADFVELHFPIIIYNMLTLI